MGDHFGSTRIVTRGRLHDAATLPGFVAWDAGERIGVVQFRVDQGECEIVALVAERPREGVGTELLLAMRDAAKRAGWSRLWLVTTNDNVVAQSFYDALGWRLAAVDAGAVTRARQLKPEIPECGARGVAIEDELVYELDPEAG